MSAGRVVIVGGGVIGITAAHFLQQQGYAVTVIDRGKIGAACSHANCGLVTPSHVLPLAEPGVLQMGLKAMFDRNGPLRIRPGLNFSLWSWLLKFAKRCNEKDMLNSAAGIHAILQSSRGLYDQLIASESLNCEWQPKGVLFVFKTPAGLDHYAEVDQIQGKNFGAYAQRMTRGEVLDFEPALRDDIAGAWYYPQDGFLRPDRLMKAWRASLEQRGVIFLEDTPMESLAGQGTDVKAVRVAGQDLSADKFLICTGAWTPMLQDQIGSSMPIQPGKGYSMTMSRPAICPQVAMLLPEHRVAVTPMESGYRLGSIMELGGYDESLREERLSLLRNGAQHYLREPLGEHVEERWYGWRPMTYDSLPIIDRAPRWGNLWVAAGHSMLGLSMAPGTGKLVTELMTGQPPHIDPHPYRISRF
jgi:D-amino-acid dehydrogenase